MNLPNEIAKSLEQPFELTEEQVLFYQTNRYIKLKQVLDEETLSYFNALISKEVGKLSTTTLPLSERTTYDKAFLQIFNLWQKEPTIQPLIFSSRLAKIAANLMQTEGVRLYHDQALFKEGGGGITPWHADQFYWPLASDKTITAWIPLQTIPLEMGPLEFSAGSHQIIEGRDLGISDQSEQILQQKLKVTDFKHVIESFNLGEISFHSGWVFHRAGANVTDQTRKVMTIIYMDSNMVLKQPENDNQVNDWHTWCPGATVGEIIDTPLNPLLYTATNHIA